jgi:hypothetical protein
MPSMQDLKPLAGRWREVIEEAEFLDEAAHGEMTNEWLRDEKVMLQRSASDNPVFPEAVAVIMEEEGEDTFAVHYFDSRSVARVYRMTFEGNLWKMWRDADGPGDFDQRLEGRLSDNGGTIEAAWHRTEDGEWLHDFDVTYTRG